MKNMIELPTEADYHKTSLIDVRESHMLAKKEDTISYKKCIINLRSIVDISEKTLVLNIIDEEKYPAYLEEVEEQKIKLAETYKKANTMKDPMKRNEALEGYFQPVPYGIHTPECPHKEVKVVGVLVLYFNGTQRLIADDYNEFQELYFKYLQKQNLDM